MNATGALSQWFLCNSVYSKLFTISGDAALQSQVPKLPTMSEQQLSAPLPAFFRDMFAVAGLSSLYSSYMCFRPVSQ